MSKRWLPIKGRPTTIHIQRRLQAECIMVKEVRELREYLISMIEFNKQKLIQLEGCRAKITVEEVRTMLKHDITMLKLVDAVLCQFETGHIINAIV